MEQLFGTFILDKLSFSSMQTVQKKSHITEANKSQAAMKTEAVNLKEIGEEYVEGFGGRKWKGEM